MYLSCPAQYVPRQMSHIPVSFTLLYRELYDVLTVENSPGETQPEADSSEPGYTVSAGPFPPGRSPEKHGSLGFVCLPEAG